MCKEDKGKANAHPKEYLKEKENNQKVGGGILKPLA